MTEQEAFIAFAKQYRLTHKPPKEPTRTTGLLRHGFIFWIKTISTLALLLLVAERTAVAFYNTAQNQTIGFIVAGLAVIGVEGLMLALAIERGKRHKKIAWYEEWLTIGALLVISLMAGLSQSLSLMESVDPEFLKWFSWALGAALTFASVPAYVGGLLIGQQIGDVDGEYAHAIRRYEEVLAEYEQALVAAWQRSPQYKVTYAPIHVEARKAKRMVDAVPQDVPVEQPERHSGRNGSMASHVHEWLSDQYQRRGWIHQDDIPPARKIIKEMGLGENALSSAVRGRERWIRDWKTGNIED